MVILVDWNIHDISREDDMLKSITYLRLEAHPAGLDCAYDMKTLKRIPILCQFGSQYAYMFLFKELFNVEV